MAGMRLLDQRSMQALFAVTDEIPLDRESLEVPLEMKGDGAVEALPGGRVRITLPDADDRGPFLVTVPERVAAARSDRPDRAEG
jgi:hypothetical protein